MLPVHLRNLARVQREVTVEVADPVTIGRVLDAVEDAYPMLRGTIRDHGTKKRRAFVRFFMCNEDYSHEPYDTALPDAVLRGDEPFLVVGDGLRADEKRTRLSGSGG
ncbi:MAG: MoaD/ThiS family protein [Caldilineaceae bacterium]